MMPAAPGFFPDHKHVETFSEILEEDYDEEVPWFIISFLSKTPESKTSQTSYVTLDLGTIDPSVIASAEHYALIVSALTSQRCIYLIFLQGLETNTPMLQLGSMIFEGTYENLLGSELLLTDAPSGMGHPYAAYVSPSFNVFDELRRKAETKANALRPCLRAPYSFP
jgi:hypothetical protein